MGTTRDGGEPLESLRKRIDGVDKRLIAILAERFGVCAEVAAVKAEDGIPMMQTGRVSTVIDRCRTLGAAAGLRPAFVSELYALIIGEACRMEDEFMARYREGMR